VSDPARLGPQLSPAERTLLARAREQRATDVVPEAVRERLLARARAEARRAPGGLPRAASLVPVGSRGAAQALAAAAAIAAGLVLLAHARGRGLPGGSLQPTAGEPADSSASEARPIGARLFQSELFRAPAAAYTGALPAPGLNLFGEAPFAPESRAWQARLWNDLGSAPSSPPPTSTRAARCASASDRASASSPAGLGCPRANRGRGTRRHSPPSRPRSR